MARSSRWMAAELLFDFSCAPVLDFASLARRTDPPNRAGTPGDQVRFWHLASRGSASRISAKFQKTFLLVVDAHDSSAADDCWGEVFRAKRVLPGRERQCGGQPRERAPAAQMKKLGLRVNT
jgi:hypothetical protein